MVREIVNIQVGQCGNNIGTKFWESISDEHNIDPSGSYYGDSDILLDHIDVYYNENKDRKYIPRAVLVDLDPCSIDYVRGGHYGQLFRPSSIICGKGSAGNNWASGFYTLGHDYIGSIFDIIRKEVESCDAIQGFQIVHSICGGTGSGLGSLILKKLYEEYPKCIRPTFTITPSPNSSDTPVDPYNYVLSMNRLIDFSKEVFIFDNESLYNICTRVLKLNKPVYNDINNIVSMVMSGTTCSSRFSGQLNSDLRKIAVNLVPLPRLHFFITGFAPLELLGSQYIRFTVPELVDQIFDTNNMLTSCDAHKGAYFAVSAQFRGRMSAKEIDEQMYNITQQNSSYFVKWIPNNIKSSICDVPPFGFNMSANFIGNTSAMGILVKNIVEKFQKLYSRMVYNHWYAGEGLEIAEFDNCYSDLCDLIMEYDMYENAGVGGYEEEIEDDEKNENESDTD